MLIIFSSVNYIHTVVQLFAAAAAAAKSLQSCPTLLVGVKCKHASESLGGFVKQIGWAPCSVVFFLNRTDIA